MLITFWYWMEIPGSKLTEAQESHLDIAGGNLFPCNLMCRTCPSLEPQNVCMRKKYATNCIQRSHYNANVRTFFPKNKHLNLIENETH